MDVTKLEHACLILREAPEALVIDPGNFTPPVELNDAVAIVVTHEHPDHSTPEQLTRILAANPGIPIIGPSGVAARYAQTPGIPPVDVVSDGDQRTVGPFALRFHGTRHAVIHSSVPVIDNTGVMINGLLFYPGDAYTVPDAPVDTLVTPLGAPWLKVAEMMDYVIAVAPRRTIPTHEHTLSAAGRTMAFDRLAEATSLGRPGAVAIDVVPGATVRINDDSADNPTS